MINMIDQVFGSEHHNYTGYRWGWDHRRNCLQLYGNWPTRTGHSCDRFAGPGIYQGQTVKYFKSGVRSGVVKDIHKFPLSGEEEWVSLQEAMDILEHNLVVPEEKVSTLDMWLSRMKGRSAAQFASDCLFRIAVWVRFGELDSLTDLIEEDTYNPGAWPQFLLLAKDPDLPRRHYKA